MCACFIMTEPAEIGFDPRFHVPSSFLVAGPSNSGKTFFALEVLENAKELFKDSRVSQNIIVYYKLWQSAYTEAKEKGFVSHWVNAMPTIEDITKKCYRYKDIGGSIVLIDDFANRLTSDVCELFSVLSHHLNVVVFLLTQNVFNQCRYFRDISLNATYCVLMKTPRGISQVLAFARQIFPGPNRSTALADMFKEATKRPHSYILFDAHQKTPEKMRIRSRILPREAPQVVWVEEGMGSVM